MIGLVLGILIIIKGYLVNEVQLIMAGSLLYLAGAVWFYVEACRGERNEESDDV